MTRVNPGEMPRCVAGVLFLKEPIAVASGNFTVRALEGWPISLELPNYMLWKIFSFSSSQAVSQYQRVADIYIYIIYNYIYIHVLDPINICCPFSCPGLFSAVPDLEGPNLAKNRVPGLVNCYITNWKDPPFFMGKSTISTGPFSIAFCKRLPEGN